MKEVILEQSELLNGSVVQLVRDEQGNEFQRTLYYTCAICGARSDRPFPKVAISCMRSDCEMGRKA
jgi:hypothetical protein